MRFVALALVAWAGVADASCRQALALGSDVSGSIDADEYRLQMDGLAAALTSSAVIDSFLTLPDSPVTLAIYEWSGVGQQDVIVTWQDITTPRDLHQIANRLRQHPRRLTNPGTALGDAIQTGFDLLAERPDCWAHTIDISGDGKNNMGPEPRDVTPQAGATIINGLIIGIDAPPHTSKEELHVGELSAYYHANVLTGAGAFLETALGFEDFERAMTRKLLRELEIPALSLLDQ